jgi:benzoyl-CoA 2,3-dioxygenase component B
LTLPSPRFHRHQGIYAGHHFNPAGELISREEFEANTPKWLLTPADNDYLISIMKPVYEPGKFANWIAPPSKGIEGQAVEFSILVPPRNDRLSIAASWMKIRVHPATS